MIQPRYVEKSAAIGVEKPRNEFLGKNHLKTHHQESDHRLVMAVHIQNPGGRSSPIESFRESATVGAGYVT